MLKKKNILLIYFILIISTLVITGLIVDGPLEALKGLWKIQVSRARLVSDFIELTSIGSTLINAALVGLVGLFLITLLKVNLSGPTFAAVFTLMGFGLFGKTPLNIAPIFLGVFLAAKFSGKKFNEYIIIALFGTALGPVVSFFAFESGLPAAAAIPVAMLIGVVLGFMLPSVAVSMLHLHQGYNLYNMGLTCGFISLFAASFVLVTGHEFSTEGFWYNESSLLLILLVPALSVSLIISGIISDGFKSFKSFIAIQKIPGRLPSDFMAMENNGGALINSGLIGLAGWGYVMAVGGDFNGPVIGGLLTIIGFGSFGTNFKNSWPVVTGVVISALVFGNSLSAPGPLLAAIFVTTLGPLAGQFGFIVGIIAGFIHFVMVMQTGGWYGGMNLYNNGFAGGLTAALLVAIIQWVKTNRISFKKIKRR
jgi:hypothetical protein